MCDLWKVICSQPLNDRESSIYNCNEGRWAGMSLLRRPLVKTVISRGLPGTPRGPSFHPTANLGAHEDLVSCLLNEQAFLETRSMLVREFWELSANMSYKVAKFKKHGFSVLCVPMLHLPRN